MPADELLDLTHGPAAGYSEPLLLGRRGRDASELARVGKADGAGLELVSGFGELFEGFGDAKLFLGEAWAVAKQALGVLVERGVAEAQVGSCAVRSEQPAPFLEVEPRSLGGETDELFIRLTPCGAIELHSDC